MSANETLAEIAAEMRRRIAVKMSDAWYTQDEWRNLCDRIEAARKRDRDDLRDLGMKYSTIYNALKDIVDVIDEYDANNPLWWHKDAVGVGSLRRAKLAIATFRETVSNYINGKDVVTPANTAKLREALEKIRRNLTITYQSEEEERNLIVEVFNIAGEALAAPAGNCDVDAPCKRLGKWLNGDNYEYEFAYCSECGHMQWADWDSHYHAREEISDFHKEYKFCPNCGASMVEGVYINGKGKNHGSK